MKILRHNLCLAAGLFEGSGISRTHFIVNVDEKVLDDEVKYNVRSEVIQALACE